MLKDLQNVALLRPRPDSREDVYFYQQWFCEAWEKAGGKVLEERIRLPWRLKQVIGRLKLCFSIGRRRKRLLITASGRLDTVGWPWCYFYELVPVVWDVWPFQIPHLLNFIRRNGVKLVFCTSSQVVAEINRKIGTCHAVWMPEAVDAAVYPMGAPLAERPIDVLEYGRQLKGIRAQLLAHAFERPVNYVYPTSSRLVEPSAEKFRQMLRSAKIAFCYPQCDTNPSRAGDIETLTQRYWECMLSGTLMVGRAPKELIDFCGYDPVVGLSDEPAQTIASLLSDLAAYQPLVDRNRKTAARLANWSERMKIIEDALAD